MAIKEDIVRVYAGASDQKMAERFHAHVYLDDSTAERLVEWQIEAVG